MKFTKFEDCEVWQMGRELVREVYSLTREGEFAIMQKILVISTQKRLKRCIIVQT